MIWFGSLRMQQIEEGSTDEPEEQELRATSASFKEKAINDINQFSD